MHICIDRGEQRSRGVAARKINTIRNVVAANVRRVLGNAAAGINHLSSTSSPLKVFVVEFSASRAIGCQVYRTYSKQR